VGCAVERGYERRLQHGIVMYCEGLRGEAFFLSESHNLGLPPEKGSEFKCNTHTLKVDIHIEYCFYACIRIL